MRLVMRLVPIWVKMINCCIYKGKRFCSQFLREIVGVNSFNPRYNRSNPQSRIYPCIFMFNSTGQKLVIRIYVED
jgi:hypothetical protein